MSVKEMTAASELTLRLKLMVDTKAKKVVFAEAGKDFVDFLFHILSLPLATVFQLLSKEETMSGLHTIFKSVESLKTEYFAPNASKDTVLQPKFPVSLPLLSVHHTPAHLTLFKCPNHNIVSNGLSNCLCGCGQKPAVKFTFVSAKPSNELPGFVKEMVAYMVMNNLEVKPMSMTLIKSLVTDLDNLVEKEVEFGLKEGLDLLRASLKTNDVLTTVFFRKQIVLPLKPKEIGKNELYA